MCCLSRTFQGSIYNHPLKHFSIKKINVKKRTPTFMIDIKRHYVTHVNRKRPTLFKSSHSIWHIAFAKYIDRLFLFVFFFISILQITMWQYTHVYDVMDSYPPHAKENCYYIPNDAKSLDRHLEQLQNNIQQLYNVQCKLHHAQ